MSHLFNKVKPYTFCKKKLLKLQKVFYACSLNIQLKNNKQRKTRTNME